MKHAASTKVHRQLLCCLIGVMSCAKLEQDAPPSPVLCSPTLPRTAPAGTQTQILGACADSAGMHVAFVARDATHPIADLVAREVRVTLAKLVPKAGGGDQWQSYINRVETAGKGAWPGVDDALQATADANGVLQPITAGVYVYTFATNPQTIMAPVAVPWEPTRRHRLALELRGASRTLPTGNPTFDFRPDGGALDAGARAVVATATCNGCHANLATHGGARTNVSACVTCHNPGTADAQSGESVELSSLVHRIHSGKTLPSVMAGGHFVIWGNANSKNDFSTVGYPQDVRNCRRCHDERDPATPEAGNWRSQPGVASCGSCHDDVAFSATIPAGKKAHPRGAKAGDNCAGCHTPEDVDSKHRLQAVTAANPVAVAGLPALKYEILGVAGTGAGAQPTATFRIAMNGQPLDVKTLPAGLTYGPRFVVGWTTSSSPIGAAADYDNQGSGQTVGQPGTFAIDAKLAATLVANADGSFTTPNGALGTIPAGARNVVVTLEGLFTFKDASGQDVRVGADTVVARAPGQPVRRAVVSVEKCNVCHERLSAHGGNRANNVAACVICHNPNATDFRQRPASVDQDADKNFDDPNAVGVDGLRERSINFAGLIHSIHAGGQLASERFVVYGFGRTPIDFKEVGFPRRLADCQACHLDQTTALPLPAGATAVSALTSPLPAIDRSLAPALTNQDDAKVTPTGAACTGCHDKPAAQAHTMMTPNFYVLRPVATEIDSCATCHGPTRPYDIAGLHAPKPN